MRKFVGAGIALGLAALSSAQSRSGFLGTKPGGTTDFGASASSPGPFAFLQMLLALGIVLVLLKFVAPKLLDRFGKRITTSTGGSLKIEETASFGGGNLYIVHAKGKTLLIGATQQSVNCLADLTEVSAAPEVPVFEELLEAEPGAQPQVSPDEDAAAAALSRLDRLTG